MKKRLDYTTRLLALALMFSGEYSAHGQGQTSGLSSISVSSRVYPTESGIPDAVAAHRNSLRNILVLLKVKLINALTLKDEKVISDVKGEVKDTLNEQFANDLAIREAKLAQLIERADNAESQYKQRLASRDELIELQLQSYMMEKDAPATGSSELDLDSLGLFGSRRQSKPEPDDVLVTDPNGLPRSSSFEPTPGNPNFRAAAPGTERPANTRVVDELADATFNSGRRLQQDSTATIKKARMKLARAATVDEETQATKELKDALSVYFLRDLEERDRLLKTVRADIEKMKQKLEKRANSKIAIVELQFKIFVNEARGLGFFSPQVTTDRFGDQLRPETLSGTSLLP